jgi:hypothetical protein
MERESITEELNGFHAMVGREIRGIPEEALLLEPVEDPPAGVAAAGGAPSPGAGVSFFSFPAAFALKFSFLARFLFFDSLLF